MESPGIGEALVVPGVSCHLARDWMEAARQMLCANVHRLLVEKDGELLGVISQSDVVRAVANARV